LGLAVASSSALANTLPTAVPDEVEVHARAAVLIDLLANDDDVDGDALSVSISGAPARGSVTDHGDGTFTYTPDPTLFEGSGGDGFTYTVDDGRGGAVSAAVSITELPVPPELQPITETVLFEETFDSGLGNWTFEDFGPNEGPSNWSVANGELKQASNIWGDAAERGTYALHSAGSAWTDYRIKVKLRSSDDDRIGVAFRYQDSDNHYRFDWRRELSSRQLVKIENGVHQALAQDVAAYSAGDDFLVEIRAEGSLIEVSVDGVLVFSVVDTSFASGSVALTCHGNQGTFFDDVRVTALPQDSLPLLFEDRFDDGDSAGWIVADSGTGNYPSSWQVTNGELVQTSNIFGSVFPRVSGTVAVAEAGHTWQNYRFRVKTRATDDDGLVFYVRFQDWQSHYAFHWNRQSNFKILGRVQGGVFTELATSTIGPAWNRDYVVEFVADGSTIEVWIDGHRYFSVQDDTLRGGTVAVGTEGLTGGYFDNVQVWALPQ